MQKHRYVVGYLPDHNVVYGALHFDNVGIIKEDQDIRDYAQRMTWWQAKRALKQLRCPNAHIFKIVSVRGNKEPAP